MSRENLSSKRYEPPTINLGNKNSSQTLLIDLIGFNKHVLEIGTSTGYISKILKEHGNTITGIEIDGDAGSNAEQYCDRMIIGDVETLDLDSFLKPETFDVILLGDVLEHLKTPSDLLEKIKKFLIRGGYLAVSLPNFFHGDVLLNLLNGDFRYTPLGLLDVTHLRFFGLKNIYTLFTECGYQISDIRTTNYNIGETELRINHEKIPEDLLNFIRSLPNSSVYQFIFTAYPVTRIAPPVPEDTDLTKLFTDSFERSMKAVVDQALSTKEEQLQELTLQVQSRDSALATKEEQLQELTLQVQSRDTALATKEEQLQELTLQVQSRDTALATKEEQLQELTLQVQSRDTALATKEEQLQELTLQVQSRDSALATKEEQLQELTLQVQSRDTALATKEEQLQELTLQVQSRDTALATKEEQLQELTSQVQSRDTALATKEEQLQELTSQVQSRDTALATKEEQLQELTSQIQSRDTALATKEEQLQELTSQIQSRDQILESIKSSITWQFTTKFQKRVIERIFPDGTRRQYLYGLILISIRIINNEGIKRFILNFIYLNKDPFSDNKIGDNGTLNENAKEFYNLFLKGKRILINEGVIPFINKFNTYLINQKNQNKEEIRYKRKYLKNLPEKSEIDKIELNAFAYKPQISIIMPVYNVEKIWLEEAIHSALIQEYENWELCIVDDASNKSYIPQVLNNFRRSDNRIKVKYKKNNSGISEATNDAINMAAGEFICFLDNDDLLTKDALFEVVKALNEYKNVDVVYSDEDKVTINGDLCEPFYKPDWSPEYFRGVMYIGHLLTVRKSLAEKVNLLNKEFDGVQDFEFMQRLSENTKNIIHIQKILYHWRKHEGSIALSSGAKGDVGALQIKAVNSHLNRLSLPSIASKGPFPHRVIITPSIRVQYPLVSIIIPTKDKPELIERCLDSIYKLTAYPNFEVIIIDNNTTDNFALNIINSYPVKKINFQEPFNFSKVNNLGAENASGDYLIFLNNDTEIQSENWIENLLYYAEQADVAAVGPLLKFPDNTVQHAGVVLGFRGTADHIMRNYPVDCDGYAGSLVCTREVSAVTAACMMVKKSIFNEVGGFNGHYATHYQDVDLCLKFITKGYRIIFCPRVCIIHYECSTRNKNNYDFIDRYLLIDQWNEMIIKGDKYYNRNFDLKKYDEVQTGYTINYDEVG